MKKLLEDRFGKTVYFTSSGNAADIAFKNQRMPTSGKLAYGIAITKYGVTITSNFAESAFQAIQTLLQLIAVNESNEIEAPFVDVFDQARFEYRGMHLDVARHIFPVPFIKKYIDYLAAYKFNKFHWHLTDDQGWRIEIKNTRSLLKRAPGETALSLGAIPAKAATTSLTAVFIPRMK